MGDPLYNFSQSFDPSVNIALSNGQYTDMKKFLTNLRNHWSDFEMISHKCSFSDPFQKLFSK